MRSNGVSQGHAQQLAFLSLCLSSGFLFRSMGPLSCMRVALRPRMEASTWMITAFVLSKYWSEPADVIACLMLSTADWCSGPTGSNCFSWSGPIGWLTGRLG